MTHQECLKASRKRELVDDDKFEKHFRRASRNDRESKKTIFDRQTEAREDKAKLPMIPLP